MNLIKDILFPYQPKSPSLALGKYDDLSAEGLTMGTLVIGRQGTGKTTSLARHLVDYFKQFPDRAIFVLDWSGSITDTILNMILHEEPAIKESLLKRIVYDELGNPEWVVPMPEFSQLYGGNYEDQVQRVSTNLAKLSPHLVQNAPLLGGLAVSEIAPHFFRLLTAITNDSVDTTETWQITEIKKLILDKALLKRALDKYGNKVPETKWYLTQEFLNSEVRGGERELRTFSLRSILNSLETREIKARLGYYRPGWTPKEAIAKGQMILVNGTRLINQRSVQHYLFTQAYSLIMSEINKRTPGNPKDKPVALVMDEVYSLLSIEGMAEEVGMISPLYRSRKLELYIVLQSLSQLDKTLRQQIWSIGNVVSFAISNFDEAYEVAQQLFKYEPKTIKLPATDPKYQPVVENDRGQYLALANWIQGLKHRECIMRRYISERQMDRYIRHVLKTKDNPSIQTEETLDELKLDLLKKHGVPVRTALEQITSRNLQSEVQTPPVI